MAVTTNGTKPLRFSVDSITVGDMEDIEEATGKPFGEIINQLTSTNGSLSVPVKTLKALVWIIYRQEHPDFTLDDARKIKVSELELVLTEPDPTEAAG